MMVEALRASCCGTLRTILRTRETSGVGYEIKKSFVSREVLRAFPESKITNFPYDGVRRKLRKY